MQRRKRIIRCQIAEAALQRHLRKPLHELVTSSRTFPLSARVDVQTALERLFAQYPDANLLGVHTQYSHETLTVSHLSLGSWPANNSVGTTTSLWMPIGQRLNGRGVTMPPSAVNLKFELHDAAIR